MDESTEYYEGLEWFDVQGYVDHIDEYTDDV